MAKQRIRITVWLLFALLGSPAIGRAHPSPSKVVHTLSHRIAEGNPTPTLLVRRGDEFRALGEDLSAIADYQAALKLQADYPSALYGLAHAYFSQQDFDSAITTADRGIRAAANVEQAGPFYAIKARIYERRVAWEAAVVAWQHALASTRPEVDWFLGEAKSLERLEKFGQARRSLEVAISQNPSVVLRRAWLEMLVKCGDIETAAKPIEAGLARARWKSSWLLLRAKLYLAQDKHAAAQRDAQAALDEINTRLRPGTENSYLAADRELAISLLERCRVVSQ